MSYVIGKYNTVTFIKVKGTEEIIGRYNPLESSSSWGKTKDNFIFPLRMGILLSVT